MRGWSGKASQGSGASAEICRTLDVSRSRQREQRPRQRERCVQRSGGREAVWVFVEVGEGQGGRSSG